MGTWGTQPLENDAALDLKSEWEDSKNIALLEEALDVVLGMETQDYLDAMDAETAIGAVSIILTEKLIINDEKRIELLQKSAAVLGRTLENSELQETWSETASFGDWLQSITNLMQDITIQLQKLT